MCRIVGYIRLCKKGGSIPPALYAMMLNRSSLRDFHELLRAGAADGTHEILRQFLAGDGENTVVASVFFHGDYSLILTVAAKTGEGQLAAFNTAAGAGFSKLRGNGNLVHIHDRVAAAADEVDMGTGVGIESFRTVYGCDAGDLTLFFEKCQISVDRCL